MILFSDSYFGLANGNNNFWVLYSEIEKFTWRGNSTRNLGMTWPIARYGATMWSNKNLLWLFGGYENSGFFGNDLYTFTDGVIHFFYLFFVFKVIAFFSCRLFGLLFFGNSCFYHRCQWQWHVRVLQRNEYQGDSSIALIRNDEECKCHSLK